jgi:hypothetical protein
MQDNATYIAEIHREVAMRAKVYPGLVKAGKMTQAAADTKIALMSQAARIFQYAEDTATPVHEITLPFSHAGSPFYTTTLEPIINEVNNEIHARIRRIDRLAPNTGTYEHAMYELGLMREIIGILRLIQHANTVAQTQLNLFGI